MLEPVVAAGALAAGAWVPKGFVTLAVWLAGAAVVPFAVVVTLAGFAVVDVVGLVDAVAAVVVVGKPSGFETVATGGCVAAGAEAEGGEAGAVIVPETTLAVTFAAPAELVDGGGVAGCVVATVFEVCAAGVEAGAAVIVVVVLWTFGVAGDGLGATTVATAVFCAGAAEIGDVAVVVPTP